MCCIACGTLEQSRSDSAALDVSCISHLACTFASTMGEWNSCCDGAATSARRGGSWRWQEVKRWELRNNIGRPQDPMARAGTERCAYTAHAQLTTSRPPPTIILVGLGTCGRRQYSEPPNRPCAHPLQQMCSEHQAQSAEGKPKISIWAKFWHNYMGTGVPFSQTLV